MKKMSADVVLEEIKKNRNHSWYDEIIKRHCHELNRIVVDYFGNKISYEDWSDDAIRMAKAMKANGIEKGDELVVFIDKIPEYLYLLGAASIVGVKINFVSEKFSISDIEEIVKNSKTKKVFVQDNKIEKLLPVISKFDAKDVITFSYERSLKNKELYKDIFDRFYDSDINMDISVYSSYDDFVLSGVDYPIDKVREKIDLNDPFTITYSSGTTGSPKGIVHSHGHYITMGRYHDSEVAGVPSLGSFSSFSNIPIYSNSYLLSIISDNLIKGGLIALDPIDDADYFLIGVKLHKANMVAATTSTWLSCAINYYLYGDKDNIKKLPDMLFPFCAGEQTSLGEEKFLNKFFKDLKSGTRLPNMNIKLPYPIAKLCVAGGTCEIGSVFLHTVYRSPHIPLNSKKVESIDMTPYNFIDVHVLRPDGTYCKPYEHGLIVISENSPCNTLGYNHNVEATKKCYVKDIYGKRWFSLCTYGYIDSKGNVSMKGRVPTQKEIECGDISTYRIADAILKDTKHIMSCEIVECDGYYIAHILPQYGVKFNAKKVLAAANSRCENEFGSVVTEKLLFRIHSFEKKFPLTNSSKRSAGMLKKEGTLYAITRDYFIKE